jgi:hypothetical protein
MAWANHRFVSCVDVVEEVRSGSKATRELKLGDFLRQPHSVQQDYGVLILVDLLLNGGREEGSGYVCTEPSATQSCNSSSDVHASGGAVDSFALGLAENNKSSAREAFTQINSADEIQSAIPRALCKPAALVAISGRASRTRTRCLQGLRSAPVCPDRTRTHPPGRRAAASWQAEPDQASR